ncbi:hypothetical protein ASZ90_012098 [hydrocarbon metagenome]|uniref:Uncharacterized protein n=1 Tax=hydrocarbon metagenome TaxID=938273 RepID=A0A0W8FCY9_9ZZZZ
MSKHRTVFKRVDYYLFGFAADLVRFYLHDITKSLPEGGA